MSNTFNHSSLPTALQQYMGAWNSHDGAAIVATFAADGSYSDPLTSGPLSGGAIGRYAENLWQSFPDLRFELDGIPVSDGETIAMPWRMLGTNSGPFNGLPPSGKAVSVAGVDIVKLSQDGLQSVVGYFDSRAVPQQLGLQVVVQPRSIGPFTFGVSTRVVSGRNATPQAFSVTSLEPRSEQEKEEIRLAGRETLKEMLGMEGFISATTVTCGNRQMTFTAWEKPENISQMRSSKHHSQATRGFYGTEFAQGGIISTWQMPTKVQTFQRCPECHKMIWVERTQGRCVCGASVEASNYW